MSENLKMLNDMFPGKLLLSPADVSQALGWDRRRIYALVESKSLPFKFKRVLNLICIPKVALAQWLDGNDAETTKELPVAEEKKKRGRPRKNLSALAFIAQAELACETNFFVSKMKSVKSKLSEDKTKEAAAIIDKAVSEVFSSEEYGVLSDHITGDFIKGNRWRQPL